LGEDSIIEPHGQDERGLIFYKGNGKVNKALRFAQLTSSDFARDSDRWYGTVNVKFQDDVQKLETKQELVTQKQITRLSSSTTITTTTITAMVTILTTKPKSITTATSDGDSVGLLPPQATQLTKSKGVKTVIGSKEKWKRYPLSQPNPLQNHRHHRHRHRRRLTTMSGQFVGGTKAVDEKEAKKEREKADQFD